MANMRRIFNHSESSPKILEELFHNIFMAEFLDPSDEIWIVSPWISNIQIFDNFIVVGKLEALNCVRLGFTDNLIQSYLQRVDETDISGLKYYQSKLDQLKSEIQDHE